MLTPVALGLGFGKFGAKPDTANQAGPSKTRTPSPDRAITRKGKEPEATPTAVQSIWSMASAVMPSAKTAMYGIGAAAVGAAVVGTAYYRREDFMNGWRYGYDHMTFVKNLWDEDGMRQRLEDIVQLTSERGVFFRK